MREYRSLFDFCSLTSVTTFSSFKIYMLKEKMKTWGGTLEDRWCNITNSEGVCVSWFYFFVSPKLMFFFLFMNLSWRTEFILQSQTFSSSFVQRLSGTQVKSSGWECTSLNANGFRGKDNLKHLLQVTLEWQTQLLSLCHHTLNASQDSFWVRRSFNGHDFDCW